MDFINILRIYLSNCASHMIAPNGSEATEQYMN